MWGIYDALSCGYIRSIDEVKNDLFNWDTFSLGYGEDKISFGDIYFINTQMDLMDTSYGRTTVGAATCRIHTRFPTQSAIIREGSTLCHRIRIVSGK